MTDEEHEVVQWIRDYFTDSTNEKENLISVLQAIQQQFGYLAKVAMKEVAAQIGATPANVYAVATFYNQFRFVPPGKHDIKICMGTACVIKRSQLVLDHWERRLGINVGEVTEDREYSLDRVDCVGCCTLAPVNIIEDKVLGEMAVTKVDGILLQHDIQREKQEKDAESKKEAEDTP